jgi:uracil phosphoribosyltransferase
MHLLVEEAIGKELTVSKTPHFSPTGTQYDHYEMRHEEDEYCGVSILRAGDSMVDPIMQLIPDIAIGKILIQRDEKTAEPIFFYQK